MAPREGTSAAGWDATRKVALPLACSLRAGEGAARLARWQRLGEEAAPRARRFGHELEVRYAPRPGVREELEALAAAEAECCAFVTWSVGEDGGEPVLRVTADPGRPDDVATIAALFGAL